MKVKTTAIKDGFFLDKYGKKGTTFSNEGISSLSIPFEITEAPKETVTFAVVLDDKDAITAAGYIWIYWTIANLKRTKVEEGESRTATDFVQGATSWSGVLGEINKEQSAFYGGMAPPNCTHRYELTVYALDTQLDVENAFGYNDLHFMMQGHILDTAVVMGKYSPE